MTQRDALYYIRGRATDVKFFFTKIHFKCLQVNCGFENKINPTEIVIQRLALLPNWYKVQNIFVFVVFLCLCTWHYYCHYWNYCNHDLPLYEIKMPFCRNVWAVNALVQWSISRVIGPHYHCVYTTLVFGESRLFDLPLMGSCLPPSLPLYPLSFSLSIPMSERQTGQGSIVSSNTLFRPLSHAHIHVHTHTALQADNPKQTCITGPRNVHVCKHSNQPSSILLHTQRTDVG